MRGRTASGVVAGVAVAGALLFAVTAYAALQVSLDLTASPSKGKYGTEVVVQPSLNATAYPGDKVEFYARMADGTWDKWGEGISVEDTISPNANGIALFDPMYMFIDESLKYPAVVRAEYVPKDDKLNSPARSERVLLLQVVKNTKTTVKVTAPKTAKKGKEFKTSYELKPNSGIGKVRVTIKSVGRGKSYKKTYTLPTDEEGYAEVALKAPRAGRYTVSAKFLGNTFGVASPVAKKTVTVK